MTIKKPPRIIQQLRNLFPGQWKYDARNYCWIGERFSVVGHSYGYDEMRGTHIVYFVRSDTAEIIKEIPPRLEKCE